LRAPRAKRDLPALYLATMIIRAGFGSIFLLFPLYVPAGSVATAQALAAYPLAELASAPIMGRLVDIWSRRWVLLSGLLSIALLTFLISLTRNYLLIALLHAAMGISAAAVTVASLTMVTDLTRQSNRGVGMGAFDFSNIVGYSAGIALATALLNLERNLSSIFMTTAALLFIAWGACALLLEETKPEAGAQRFALNPLQGLDPGSRALLPLWFALTTVLGVIFFLPRTLIESGLTSSQTGLLLLAGAGALGLGSVFFGRLSDKVGRGRIMGLGLIGAALLVYFVRLAASYDPPKFFELLPMIGPSALLASALVPSALAYVGDRARLALRGTAMGLYSMMLSAGIASGNLLAGYLHELGGLSAILDAVAGLLALSLMLSALLLRRAGLLRWALLAKGLSALRRKP